MIKILNQETLVPIGLAVMVIGASAMWITDVTSQVKMHSVEIKSLAQSNEAQLKLIYEVNQRLSRIEWQLFENLNKKTGDKNGN